MSGILAMPNHLGSSRAGGSTMNCVFCDIVAGKAEAIVVARWSDATAIEPLNPVTAGHIIFIPNQHVRDAVEDPNITARLMF
jgi:histidine triad (HIT) family protein